MPKLSAAVEVAVYRIASEALHNVVKHAQATTCQISIEIDGGCLILKVIDDGKSLPPNTQAGIGINSMKERAAELGGNANCSARRSIGYLRSRAHPPGKWLYGGYDQNDGTPHDFDRR